MRDGSSALFAHRSMTREEMGKLRGTTVFDLFQAKLATSTRLVTRKSSQLQVYRSSLIDVVSTIRSLCQNKFDGLLSYDCISGRVRHSATIEICQVMKEHINQLHERVDALTC